MKHIVHVSNDFEPVSGGINTHLKNLLPALTDLNVEITLLVPVASESRPYGITEDAINESTNVRVIRAFHRTSSFKPLKFYHLTKATMEGLGWIRENVKEIDGIHQHDRRATRLGAASFARKHDIPLIWTNHSSGYFDKDGFLVRMILKRFNDKPDGWIAVHRSMAVRLRESAFKDIPVRYIPNGADPDRFKSDHTSEHEKRVVLFPQRFIPVKGPDILAEAAAEILATKDTGNLSFWFTGNGVASNRSENVIKNVKEILSDYLHTGNVEFFGNVPYETMPGYYRQADIVVLPLQRETENISVFEAWASGTPLITTDQVEKNGYMRDEENCLIVPKEDPAKLADAILRLSNDTDLRKRLARNGRAMVEERFTWLHAAKQTAQFYHEVFENDPS